MIQTTQYFDCICFTPTWYVDFSECRTSWHEKSAEWGISSNNLQSEEHLGFKSDQIEIPQVVGYICNKTTTMWEISSKNLQSQELSALILYLDSSHFKI